LAATQARIKKEHSAVTSTPAHSVVSPQEAPSSAAELTIALEPFPATDPLEVPGAAAELTIALEPDEGTFPG
jgi:hypothetical protein